MGPQSQIYFLQSALEPSMELATCNIVPRCLACVWGRMHHVPEAVHACVAEAELCINTAILNDHNQADMQRVVYKQKHM